MGVDHAHHRRMNMLDGYDATVTAHQGYPVAPQLSSQIMAQFKVDNQQIGITKFFYDIQYRDHGAMHAVMRKIGRHELTQTIDQLIHGQIFFGL